jgi:hypothetical protein
LRKYFKAGKLSTAVATRQVEDRFIPLSPEEGGLYQQVENYISETYNAAASDARNAVGFVMTIYRRRLASADEMKISLTKSRRVRKSTLKQFQRMSAVHLLSKRSLRLKK